MSSSSSDRYLILEDYDELKTAARGRCRGPDLQEFISALKQGTKGKARGEAGRMGPRANESAHRDTPGACIAGPGERAGRLGRDGPQRRCAAPSAPSIPARCGHRAAVSTQTAFGHSRRVTTCRDGHQNQGPWSATHARRRGRKGHLINGCRIMHQGAATRFDRYQGPRHLLRGLRDRGPARCRADPRAEKFQGSESDHQDGWIAHQDGPPDHPAASARARISCHHRRAKGGAEPRGRGRMEVRRE